MSRFPKFVLKNAPATVATARAATPATAGAECSSNSDNSSSAPANTEVRRPDAVATIATVAVATPASEVLEVTPAEAERCRCEYEERAAIREYDGGLSRIEAEAGAIADCAVRYGVARQAVAALLAGIAQETAAPVSIRSDP